MGLPRLGGLAVLGRGMGGGSEGWYAASLQDAGFLDGVDLGCYPRLVCVVPLGQMDDGREWIGMRGRGGWLAHSVRRERCNSDSSPEPSGACTEGGNPVRGSVLLCLEPGVPRVARGTPGYLPVVPAGRGGLGERGGMGVLAAEGFESGEEGRGGAWGFGGDEGGSVRLGGFGDDGEGGGVP
jgi:hypothetical protein